MMKSMLITSLMNSIWFICSGSRSLAITLEQPKALAKEAITIFFSSLPVTATRKSYEPILCSLRNDALLALPAMVITSICVASLSSSSSSLSITVMELPPVIIDSITLSPSLPAPTMAIFIWHLLMQYLQSA